MRGKYTYVADFLLADECLGALAETGNIAMVLGERRHNLGVASDESGVDACLRLVSLPNLAQ